MTPRVAAAREAADVSDAPPPKRRGDGLTFARAAATRHLAAVDPLLARLIAAAGSYAVRPESHLEPFRYLIRSIVFQQLNGTAAGTIHGRLLELYGGDVPTPEQLLTTDVETLRSVGISGNKAASLHDLARHAAAGALPTADMLDATSDLDLVRALTDIRGIGPWTVHMLLIFHLGRSDVLPTGDFGVREGWRLLHGRELQPTPAQFRAETEAWRPYRSVASWYMYRAVDLHRTGELEAVLA